LLITNLPSRPWSYKHILQLYQARWQIELLFKRMKQMMDMHVIRSKTPKGCESSLASQGSLFGYSKSKRYRKLALFCSRFISVSILLFLIERRENSVHGSSLRSVFKRFSSLFKGIGQDHASISVYRIFNAFCIAVREGGACSPIRFVLS
jgi:hypothetical protein